MSPVTSRCDSKSNGASNPARMGPGPNPAPEQRSIVSNGVNRWERVDEAVAKGEQILIVIFLSFMILLAFLQIVLRNFFSTGLDWGDLLLRNLVLWVGFIGATLATKEGRHLHIDVVSRWLPSLGKQTVALLTHLFSFLIACLLAYAALKFVKNEAQMGSRTFLNIPIWVPEMILPMTFVLMTFRFGLRSFQTLFAMGKIAPRQERKEGS